MDGIEIFIIIGAFIFTYLFFRRWYTPLLKAWPPERNILTKIVLTLLPIVFLALITFTLKFLASFDVVDSLFYILFYIVLGYTWMYGNLFLMTLCFDLHWPDDAIHLNNKAALAAITGEFFALAFIYAGANVGDGPGWWCVLFAGSLGVSAWVVLGFIINYCTGIFERITVERNIGCGIRFCLYQIATGAILGYGCSGDGTSFPMTVVEFKAAWPVLPLTGIYILVELLYKRKTGREAG
jgi:hypothetical protein